MTKPKNLLTFFLEVSKLKNIHRTGWVWLGIKNAETVAEHLFGAVFFAWLLGQKSDLKTRKLMELALLHDICEVYAGDLTPYYGIAPKDEKKRKEFTKRWVRLSQKQKGQLLKKRVGLEKRGLIRLIRQLDPALQRSILAHWGEFEYGLTPEGKFVKQIDKVEAMLQAISYFGTKPGTAVTSWWEGVEEMVDNPLVVRFVKAIENKLYYKKKTEFDDILCFLIELHKLKRKPQPRWVFQGIVKQPDTEANHVFMLLFMTWVLAKEYAPQLNTEKLLKMILVSRIARIDADDISTVYDSLLKNVKSKQGRQEIIKKWVRYSLKEKREIYQSNKKEEKKILQKHIVSLASPLRKEMVGLWEERKSNHTPEARFINQVYILETLLQALHYWNRDKRFPIEAAWEWAFEGSDTKMNLELLAVYKEYFYQKRRRS